METVVAAVLIALAAMIGAVLATLRVTRKRSPVSLTGLHGLTAAAGLAFLFVGVARMESTGLVGVALGTFVLAALGGGVLFALHLLKKPLPVGLIAAHALVAVAAFVLLLVNLLGG